MSDPSLDLVEAKRRSRNYWEIDGIPQVSQGLSLVLFGQCIRFADWGDARLHAGSLLGLAPLVGISLWILFILREQRFLEWVKASVTYPRTGYVQSPTSLKRDDPESPLNPEWTPAKRKTAKTFVAIACALISLFYLAAAYPALAKLFLPSIGLLPFIFLGGRELRRSRREWIVDGGVAVAWITGWFLGQQGNRVLYALNFVGFWLLVAGAIQLIQYLLANPILRAKQ